MPTDDLTLLHWALKHINERAAALEAQMTDAKAQILEIERQLAWLIAERNRLLTEAAAARTRVQ